MGNRAHWRDTLTLSDSQGRLTVASGATVTVYDQGTTTPVSFDLYSEDDNVGNTTHSNPLTAGNDGEVSIYTTDEERFDLLIAKTGYTSKTITIDTLEQAATANTITVRKNSGADVGNRARLNLIEGTGIGLTVTDDAAGGEVDVTVASTVGSDLTTHINDTSAAHAASAISFSPAGTIAGTDAQTAIAEVATDAASALSTHEADTTSVHGITDTSALLTTTTGIAKAIVDAKGDLIAATAADTVARVAVGANDTVLMADSAQAAGIKWGSVSTSDRSVIAGFSRGSIPASLSADQLARTSSTTPLPVLMSHAGSIIGVTAVYGSSRAAGTATFEVYKNGAATGLTCVLNGTDVTYAYGTQAAGTDTFVAGDRLDVRLTTSGTWNAADGTKPVEASITVQFS